jgi:hypothetical protein
VFCELMTTCSETGTPQFPDNKSKVLFNSSYVAGGTWVSGTETTVKLSLSVLGYTLNLDINKAVLTADLSGDPPNQATNGIIAGVLETDALIDSLVKVAGGFSTSLCAGPTLEGVKANITGASDIMKDGTQDENAFCDGISIGLGFDMKAVKLGTVLDKNPPGEDPCSTVSIVRQGLSEWDGTVAALTTARAEASVRRTDLDVAMDAWRRQMERTYGSLVAQVGRTAAERFFPKTRRATKKRSGNDGGGSDS